MQGSIAQVSVVDAHLIQTCGAQYHSSPYTIIDSELGCASRDRDSAFHEFERVSTKSGRSAEKTAEGYAIFASAPDFKLSSLGSFFGTLHRANVSTPASWLNQAVTQLLLC